MTEEKRRVIRNWLNERKEIYEKYAKELNAEIHPFNPQIWVVPEDGEMKILTQSKKRDTDAALSLISNHSYYMGAKAALEGWGII